MRPDLVIFETGPRDGLQNEPRPIATADKIALVDRLSACGLAKIEVTSFVRPDRVPQLADAKEVMTGIRRRKGTRYTALAPNLRGYEAARAAGADEVAIFASASEGFSQRNINCSIEQSLERFRPVAAAAAQDDLPVRGYVSCIVRCPYDGDVSPAAVRRVAEALLAMGCYEVSLGDTIGAATPESIRALLETLLRHISVERLAGHFHDTGGRAVDNVEASFAMGIRTFDSAVGGLGGCPFAPGAKGNVATEAVAAWAVGRGLVTGLDPDRLAEAARFARSLRGPA